MSPRRRSKNKRGWPANLYERKGYYSWRDPRTRVEFGLGNDKNSAFHDAVAMNLHRMSEVRRPSLIDRVTGAADRSVAAWAKHYEEALAKQQLADNTRRTYRSHNRRVVTMFGASTPLVAITPLEVGKAVDTIVAEGKVRTAQAWRHFLRDWFREACVQGWCTVNPVLDTKLGARVIVKRDRLSLEVFRAVYERETLAWAKNAYALAIVSAQRREDVVAARFADFDEKGWRLTQLSEKSQHPHRIFVPFDLRLDAMNLSLGDVYQQCRRSGVLSRHLVHQSEPRGNSPVGSPIWCDTLSKRFSTTLAGLGLDFAPKKPPTFHEIRSLSERLYAAQGGVNTQHLLGHTDASMTAVYHDTRGSEYVDVMDAK